MQPLPDPIRWGICSTGNIASQFCEAFAAVDGAEIVAVASRTQESADAFADRFNIERRHASYEALAADDNVDVVYIASPHSRHRDDTLLMLGGGRHVLCEKAFALSGAESREMIAAAKDNDLFLMEAQWARFHPGYVKLKELVDNGAIGTPQMVEANFMFRVPPDGRPGSRLFEPDLGGGALLDLGVYPIHLALLALGPPLETVAMATMTDKGVDETVVLTLRHNQGALSILSASVGTWGTNTARVMGTEGHIEIDAFMHAFRRMTLHQGKDETVIEPDPPSLHWQALEVNRCLREGVIESPRMPHSDTLAIMDVVDSARSQIGLQYPDGR